MREHIVIRCDDASHPARLVAVADFYPTGDGRWRADGHAAAVSLDEDDRPTGDSLEQLRAKRSGEPMRRAVRSRYRLTCRKCRQRSVVVREENLYAALDKLAAHGVSEVSMAALAAILRNTSGVTEP